MCIFFKFKNAPSVELLLIWIYLTLKYLDNVSVEQNYRDFTYTPNNEVRIKSYKINTKMDVIRCEFLQAFRKKQWVSKWDSNLNWIKMWLIHILAKFPVLFWYTYHSASIQPVKASGKHQEQSNPTLWWLEPNYTKWMANRQICFAFFPDVPLAPEVHACSVVSAMTDSFWPYGL